MASTSESTGVDSSSGPSLANGNAPDQASRFSLMDSTNDVDFDAYWEEESRNKTRNRIRVGRQYQASVPPLLKDGEDDDRRLQDLETLYWRPFLNDQAIQEYLSMAKSVSVFSRTLDTPSHESLQSAIRGLTEFVMSHHPCHRDAGCRMSVKTNWTNKEAELLALALERCENAYRKKLAEEYDESGSDLDGNIEDTSDNESTPGGAQPYQAAACAGDLPIDVNPPSEIKPVQARIIGRKADSPADDGTVTSSGALSLAAAGTKLRDGANTSQQSSQQDSTAPGQGSLKFYLGGQLILKLNAHQERKTWIEAPDNPAGTGAGHAVAGGNRRKAGRKAHRSSTTSTGIAWPERGSPSQESTSSIDSHNSTTTPTPSSTSSGLSLSSLSGNNGNPSNQSSSAQLQPTPLDLSSQPS